MKLELGTWLSIGSPVIAELASESGFDWVLIDLEHGCGTEAAVLPQLQAANGNETKSIVRVGAPYPDLIARVLDQGADGIMVPHVNTSNEAGEIVRSTRYAPHGTRGFSRSVRANDYGLHSIEEVDPPIIMAQIETVEGVENAVEISKVDGIDVLFVGPADLQHDLRHSGRSSPEDYEQCLSQVSEAAIEAQKKAGILLRDWSDVTKFRDLNFSYIAVDSDLAILRENYQEIINDCKNQHSE